MAPSTDSQLQQGVQCLAKSGHHTVILTGKQDNHIYEQKLELAITSDGYKNEEGSYKLSKHNPN